MLEVSLMERLFDNRIYESNLQNAYFGALPFDGDQSLLTRWQIYCINDDIVFRLKMVWSLTYKQT